MDRLSLSGKGEETFRHPSRVNETGEISLFVLQQMDGCTPLQTIAAQLRERFPNRFKTDLEALSCAGKLSEECSL
jgi:hypothetical protein